MIFITKQSLSRLRRQLPLHKGAFFMVLHGLSNSLTSTAFVSTNTKYGIPLSRYTVFLKTVFKSIALSSAFLLKNHNITMPVKPSYFVAILSATKNNIRMLNKSFTAFLLGVYWVIICKIAIKAEYRISIVSNLVI